MGRDEDVGHGRPSIPTGTWRRPGSVGEAARADERHEDARAVRRLAPVVAVADDERQVWQVARPDRDDEPTAVGQLVAQLDRDRSARPRSR